MKSRSMQLCLGCGDRQLCATGFLGECGLGRLGIAMLCYALSMGDPLNPRRVEPRLLLHRGKAWQAGPGGGALLHTDCRHETCLY